LSTHCFGERRSRKKSDAKQTTASHRGLLVEEASQRMERNKQEDIELVKKSQPNAFVKIVN
jgi:hypothetical protein